jgi:hypothetical protein
MTVASRLIDYIFHSDMGEEEIFDPTSISNGGWDQKLDHLPGLIYSSCCQNRDRNRNYFFLLILILPSLTSFRDESIARFTPKGVNMTFLTKHPSQTEVGIKS